ncbi:MAG: R3H domain-containing nucleic acid-binding protein [bacterium]
MNQDNLEKIKEISEEFFQQIDADAELNIRIVDDKVVSIDLRIEEPQMLIGSRGLILVEIQHLLKAMLKKNIEEDFYIDLDINDYKKKKNEYLKQLTEALAEEVALTGKEKVMPSMPAYERRIVHMILAGREDVISESVGEEPERKVIIKPGI